MAIVLDVAGSATGVLDKKSEPVNVFRRCRAWWHRWREVRVSRRWVRQCERDLMRIEFHGPAWNWRYLQEQARKRESAIK